MRLWLAIRFWLRARMRGGQLRAQIDEELEYHLLRRAEELREQGVPLHAAHRTARMRFGDMDRARRACRDAYMVDSGPGDGTMSELWSDVRLAFRSMVQRPAFSAAIVLTLALGIGANSAIFSVLQGVLLRPLPYADPGELVRLWQSDRVNETRFENFSAPDFFDVVDRNDMFESAALVETRLLTLTGPEGDPERVTGMATSHSLMQVLGIQPAVGRWFTEAEDAPGGERVAVLGEGLWRTRFGGDPSVSGRSVILDGVSYVIVGVASPELEFPAPAVQLWVPLQITPESRSRGQHNFPVVARLADGVRVERANANLARVAAALEAEHPVENTGRGMWAQPLHESVVGNVSQALWLIAAAVGFVLLIACVNVANLLITRSLGRQREMAVRASIGASRGRLARQLLTEYTVLGGAGGVLGLAIAFIGIRALLGLDPGAVPRLDTIGVNGPVLIFTAVVSLLTGLLCGLVPALGGSRTDLRSPLTAGGRGGGPARGETRLQSGLVVIEVALSVVLISSAGLLVRSFSEMQSVDPGFVADGVLAAGVQLPAARYGLVREDWPDYPALLAFQRDLMERLSALPGVTSVAYAVNDPTDPGWTTNLNIEGMGPDRIDPTEEVRLRVISSGYPRTIGMELVRGRLPEPRDDLFDSPPVALVNEALVERYFGTEDPIGRSVSNWGIRREIIGVVRDVRFMGVAEPAVPAVYPLFARMPFGGFSILVRTNGDPLTLAGPLRAQVLEIDPDLAIGSISTLDTMLAARSGQSRFNALLLAVFAGLALLLAAVGIYGVISFGVSRRTHEFGVRLSVGATRSDVARTVIGRAMALTAAGVLLGIGGALASSRLLTSLLFEVRPSDPVHLVGVAILAVAVAFLAAFMPARRASRIEPVLALRGD
jgi:putative ABC transport system permease protein